jgi:hypothetical protein
VAAVFIQTPVILRPPHFGGRRISAVVLALSRLQQTAKMLRGVYPERTAEILRYAQDDSEWAQHDSIQTPAAPAQAVQKLACFKSILSTACEALITQR